MNEEFEKNFNIAKNDLLTMGIVIIAQQLMLLEEPAKRGSMNYYIKHAKLILQQYQNEILNPRNPLVR
ncbi:MAG: hypothetical protein UR18_C0006G0040 [Candidatus Nomurabacteria bacterium GW2011_GWE2_31_40]|nr:MAG: hypothetical protein UR18_C0006G0040 [Candidatus Nomurabacteria bacterium GW2011_GWE2_31_40]OGV06184.1 MAG: hypothetical protein A2299_12160 [Stygiobacter sp. RIFOXYB2_FULL_37_11]OGV27878.1 MAG: hypothetical protein A2499_17195 [Stygiobacter sp. RIFOXYC12_FULL_38_8]